MSKLKVYTLETCDMPYAELDPERNKYKTETAGYVPLEVKLKRFQEAGLLMQFNSKEFTSTDYRQMYLNPDFEITPEDDFEDIQEKLSARAQMIKKIKDAKSVGEKPAAPVTSEGGTVDPEPEKAKE